MYRYLSTPYKLLRHHGGALAFLQNRGFCVKATPKSNKVYDLSNYQFPYTPEETKTILDILNQSSVEELSHFKITKGPANKLIKLRLKIGNFENIHQLLNLDGFGLKNVEMICDKVLKDISSFTEEDDDVSLQALFLRKRLVKPELLPHVEKNIETILAFDVTAATLSWTLFDRDGTVLDLDYAELLSKEQRLSSPQVYDKIVSVVNNIPKGDVYVWEEKFNYGNLQKSSLPSLMILLRLAQMQGMLSALLDTREEGQEDGRLFYVKDVLVSKLFDLKVGDERISGVKLADELMKHASVESVRDWLPPLVLDKETQEKYFSLDIAQRTVISTPLFLGLAFQQTCIKNNECAYKLLIN